MTDKEKLREIKVLADAMYNAAQYLTTDASRLHDAMEKYHQFVINEYYKEEPVSEDRKEAILKKAHELAKEVDLIKGYFPKTAIIAVACDMAEWCDAHPVKKPVSDDLEEAAMMHYKDVMEYEAKTGLKPAYMTSFKAGANWQKEHLWKPADGDDLPEIDREVIALVKLDGSYQIPPNNPVEFGYMVVFAHRPKKYWDGKSIVTGKVTRNYPKSYDKGGWNIPDVKYWLDVELPKE